MEQAEDGNRIEFAYLTRENMLYNLTPFSRNLLDIPYVQLQSSDLVPIDQVIAKIPAELSLRKFLGFEGVPIYLSTLSPIEKLTRGSNDNKSVSLKSRQSYTTMTNSQFLTYAKLLKADVLVTLCEEKDADPKKQLGKKSDKRAVKKMLTFFDEAVALKKSASLMDTKLVAPIIDTDFDDIRQEMVKSLLERIDNLGGILICSLNQETMSSTYGNHVEHVLKSLETLRDDSLMKGKIIGSSALGDPVDVLRKVNWGFNLFESAYPFRMAEKGYALDFWPKQWFDKYKDYEAISSDLDKEKLKDDLDVFHRKVPYLDLKNKDFMSHKDSLYPTMESYPFKGYSKAYICHLLNNDEMTGNVLLTLHNCFIYQEFFKVINRREFWKNANGLIYAFCRFVCT